MRKLMLLTGAALAIAFAVLTAPRPLAQSFNAASRHRPGARSERSALFRGGLGEAERPE